MQKSEFFKLPKLSYAETVAKASQSKDEKEKNQIISAETAKDIYGFDDLKICGAEIVAVGKFGGYVFDLSGNLQRELYFEPKVEKISIFGFERESFRATLDKLRIVDFRNDGNCSFISQGSVDGVAVFDNQGRLTWRYGERPIDVFKQKSPAEEDAETYVTEAAVGDLTDDGVLEYIFSVKNEGIRAFDINKNELWFQPDAFPTADFRVVDLDGDGTTELLEFQGMSSTIRDKKTGNVIKKLEIDDGWRKDFLVYEDAAGKRSVRFYEIEANKFAFSDASNKILSEMDAPLSKIKIQPKKPLYVPTPYAINDKVRAEPVEISSTSDTDEVSDVKAVWVTLQKDKPKYLAVIGSFFNLQRTNFYLYDEKGTLVYHELLPEEARTMSVLAAQAAGEEILIGGKDTIWKFSAK